MGDLNFAKSIDDGQTWSTSTIDTSGAGKWTSITSPTSGTIYISYREHISGNNLKFAKSEDAGQTWNITVIQPCGDTDTSISSPTVNNIFISYYDDTSEDLKFAKYIP